LSDPEYDALRTVAGPVSRETFERLRAFQVMFQRWSARINLVAPSTLADVWARHILDSAQLLPLGREAARWLDLGSGGGYPGAVVAILLADRPAARIDLVESNRKKAAFLSTVLSEIGIRANVHAQRIEAVHGTIAPPEIVTARALAPLSTLLDMAAPWLTAGSRGLFHKGRDFQAEIEETVPRWSFDLVEHSSVTERGAVILEVNNLRRRNGRET
jgi:16S rRNA (guanine527-N7)-methyltransferase